MFKPLRPQLAWFISLFLLSLLLTACGGATQATPDQTGESATTSATENDNCDTDASCGSVQTDQAAAPSTTEPQAQQPAVTTEATEVAATTEAAANENPAATSQQAICQPVDIPSNELITPVSAEDWSKGPANASITIIEYGDFQ